MWWPASVYPTRLPGSACAGRPGSLRCADSRLDRHRGRPPALDRLPGDAHSGGANYADRIGYLSLCHRRGLSGARGGIDRDLASNRARTNPVGSRAALKDAGAGMTAIDGLALIVLLGLIAYAVLGGADFGAGVW